MLTFVFPSQASAVCPTRQSGNRVTVSPRRWDRDSCQFFRMRSPHCSCPKAWWVNTDLWWLRSHSQLHCHNWYLPTAESHRHLCDIGWWWHIHQTWSCTYISTACRQRTFEQPLYNQYIQRSFPQQPTSAAPSIFQWTIENLLQGTSQVSVYLDDVLLTGQNDTENLQNLFKVLHCMAEAGMCLNRNKCCLCSLSVSISDALFQGLGFSRVEKKGKRYNMHNSHQLKSFLWPLKLVFVVLSEFSYQVNTLASLATETSALDVGPSQHQAFEAAKHLLTSSAVLVHFSDQKELIVACDTSSYGVGTVSFQRGPDGTEKPIANAIWALAPGERHYSQLDRKPWQLLWCSQVTSQFYSLSPCTRWKALQSVG